MIGLGQLAILALLLGIASALHPCPLAAITVVVGLFQSIGRSTGRLAAFSLGIICAFTVLGIVVCSSIDMIPGASYAIPRIFKPFLGPILILSGMLQARMIDLPPRWKISMGTAWKNSGIAGCFLGGCLLALAFCPATAGIYFAVVIPMTLGASTTTVPLAAYGIGFAAVPAVLMGVMTISSAAMEKRFGSHAPTVVPAMASGLIIVGGIVLTLKYTFNL